MPIAQLLELWKKIEVEPMEIEVSAQERRMRAQQPIGGTREVSQNGLLRAGDDCVNI